jgi:hypothetical protein
MLSLNQEYASLNVSMGDVLAAVNVARRAVYNSVREKIPHLLTVKMTGSNPITFVDGDQFDRDNGAMRNPGGSAALISARKVSQMEDFTVQAHTYAAASTTDPTYTVVGKIVQLKPTGGNCVVYYLKPPTDLALGGTEDDLPTSLHTLVLRYATVTVLEKLAMTDALEVARTEYTQQLELYKQNWDEADENMRQALEGRKGFQNMR